MPADDLTPEFLLVANPDTNVDIEAALGNLDQGRLENRTVDELFPETPGVGRCRICGQEAALTREHIPPRTAFNRARGRSPSLLDWYQSPGLEVPDTGPIFQGGVWGYMLCEECNNTTGRYGREYGMWATGAAFMMQSLERSLEELDQLDQYAYANVHLRDVYPARFVRQAISMVLSVSGSHELADRHPELRQLALGGAPVALPEPMRLFLGLYAGPMVRFAGGSWGQPQWSETARAWTWAIEVAFPPFAVQLMLDGDTDQLSGVDIAAFADMNPDEPTSFDVEGWMIGFGHLPHPLDYRPLGMLR